MTPGTSSTSPATRDCSFSAPLTAVTPPMLVPTSTARPTPKWSSTARRSSARE
ncbi:hypothetical protein QF037_005362 [Streptomyces canus]|nr:hypothetical protein [Streptomyces canus]